MKDLVVLVPDRNLEYAVRGILGRARSLGIRPVSVDILTHPAHDPGCFSNAPEFLLFTVDQAEHALVLLDHHGSGHDHRFDRVTMEADLKQRLSTHGWEGRCSAVVIDPELENWVWSDSPHVAEVLGWADRRPSLRDWLIANGYMGENDAKPAQPKEAMLAAIRVAGKSRTSRLYADLAKIVGFSRCTDAAFVELKRVLRGWFGLGEIGI